MPENQIVEWKEIWKDDYLPWLCGFANSNGGTLVVGKDNRGNVCGVRNATKLLQELPSKIRDTLGIIVDINLKNEGDKEYLEIVVPSYPIAISCQGAYYQRSGSTNQKLSGPALEAFILQRRGATWDQMPLPSCKISDIDDGLITRFKQLALGKGRISPIIVNEEKAPLLEKLHLTNGPYLTNAAALLFCKSPETFTLGAYSKIGFFKTNSDLQYQDEIHGSILEQIDGIIEILHLKYMKARISYNGLQRIERYFVPDEALREALLNALCHKDYASGIPIQISVYEDKLYVANSGRLPENWSIVNLFEKHPSKPFNPSIANVLYLVGYIESWGRGIEKISSSCREHGIPQPRYDIHPGDIMIGFSATEPRSAFPRTTTTEQDDNPAALHHDGDCDECTDRCTDGCTVIETKILQMLRTNSKSTYAMLAEANSVSRRTVAKAILNLKKRNLIQRIGSDRNGFWKIRLE